MLRTIRTLELFPQIIVQPSPFPTLHLGTSSNHGFHFPLSFRTTQSASILLENILQIRQLPLRWTQTTYHQLKKVIVSPCWERNESYTHARKRTFQWRIRRKVDSTPPTVRNDMRWLLRSNTRPGKLPDAYSTWRFHPFLYWKNRLRYEPVKLGRGKKGILGTLRLPHMTGRG